MDIQPNDVVTIIAFRARGPLDSEALAAAAGSLLTAGAIEATPPVGVVVPLSEAYSIQHRPHADRIATVQNFHELLMRTGLSWEDANEIVPVVTSATEATGLRAVE